MDRKALGVLAVAIVLAMFVVVFVGDAGLTSRTESLAKAELASFEQAERTFAGLVGQVDRALADEPALFAAGGYDARWAAMVEQGRERLASAQAAATGLRTALEADAREQEEQAREQIAALNAARVGALAAVEPAASEASRLLTFKAELPGRLEAMARDREAIMAVDLAPLSDSVQRAAIDWPEKAEDLRSRLMTVASIPDDAARRWAESADLREAAQGGTIDAEGLVSLARDAEAMSRARAALGDAPENLLELVDQLYRSWDKILVDMEIVEGADVGFRHRYRTVYTPVRPGEGGGASGMLPVGPADGPAPGVTAAWLAVVGVVQDGGAAAPAPDGGPAITDPAAAGVRSVETTETVSKAEYEAMKGNLGMVVAHKAAGRYDHEAERLVQPAGFQYVAPYGERNRYGYWSGGFWQFYGQYAFMRDVFWGRGWRVGRDDWNDYQRHRSSGQTYYGGSGNDRRYGSEGTATRSRYAQSRYVQTDGFRNSQYVRSGGAYRGSRYATSSSGGSRSGGYSRSGGRFGGK